MANVNPERRKIELVPFESLRVVVDYTKGSALRVKSAFRAQLDQLEAAINQQLLTADPANPSLNSRFLTSNRP